jgi:hypothetical protein
MNYMQPGCGGHQDMALVMRSMETHDAQIHVAVLILL